MYKDTFLAVQHNGFQFSLSSRHTPQTRHIKVSSKKLIAYYIYPNEVQLKKEVIHVISISKCLVWNTSLEPNCNSDLDYTTFTETLNKTCLCLQFCTAAKFYLFLCWQYEGSETNMYSERNLNLKERSMRKITSYGPLLFVCILIS